VRRREFITLVGGAVTGRPLAARAQQTKVARIGFLGLDSASSHAARLAALRAGLRDLGWLEGTNLLIEYRWAEGNYERLSASPCRHLCVPMPTRWSNRDIVCCGA
jgi:putative tryptophan/tyrosine transport system substrate-binding protein